MYLTSRDISVNFQNQSDFPVTLIFILDLVYKQHSDYTNIFAFSDNDYAIRLVQNNKVFSNYSDEICKSSALKNNWSLC